MPKLEPVRWYAIVAAVLAIAAHYSPDIPTPLFLGLAAAVLGVGSEVTRAAVTPMAKLRELRSARRQG